MRASTRPQNTETYGTLAAEGRATLKCDWGVHPVRTTGGVYGSRSLVLVAVQAELAGQQGPLEVGLGCVDLVPGGVWSKNPEK